LDKVTVEDLDSFAKIPFKTVKINSLRVKMNEISSPKTSSSPGRTSEPESKNQAFSNILNLPQLSPEEIKKIKAKRVAAELERKRRS